ncbi:alpha/beta hydrolase [Neobacillus sp. OS1-33]|uniref:alpha/beta hydrolase n=1 Tax=Neobacillus sp. OS1-33 TaxID=3070683 RepID=UPI0027E1D5FB|nr:alpha/beta hydrolase [Neobacillus sp. OS1-33]WML23890.1 alpha/beta hydrolase [Neobacillus sp. OS1-33]
MATEGTFNGVAGAELFFRVIEPLSAPKAAVILVHGHGDHSGGLRNLSASLVNNEYIVYALDLRGHGKSTGKRGFIRNWDEFRGDLHAFRKLVSLDQPDLPLYIVGHSMGGLIALEYALDYSSGISGMIAISPAISYEVTPFEQFGITLMGKVKPDYTINKLANTRMLLKKNSELHAKYYSDRLRHNTVTPGLGSELIQAVSRTVNQAQSIKLPLLLQYGLDDKITPPTKLRQFFHQVASTDKQLYEYALVKHRPFDGVGREKFLGDLVGWLDQQLEKKQKVLYREMVRV